MSFQFHVHMSDAWGPAGVDAMEEAVEWLCCWQPSRRHERQFEMNFEAVTVRDVLDHVRRKVLGPQT